MDKTFSVSRTKNLLHVWPVKISLFLRQACWTTGSVQDGIVLLVTSERAAFQGELRLWNNNNELIFFLKKTEEQKKK